MKSKKVKLKVRHRRMPLFAVLIKTVLKGVAK